MTRHFAPDSQVVYSEANKQSCFCRLRLLARATVWSIISSRLLFTIIVPVQVGQLSVTGEICIHYELVAVICRLIMFWNYVNQFILAKRPFCVTWANSVESDQTPHCLLSALSEIVNYYPTTPESEMDPSVWQYCEIPLGIYGFSLNNNNNNNNSE